MYSDYSFFPIRLLGFPKVNNCFTFFICLVSHGLYRMLHQSINLFSTCSSTSGILFISLFSPLGDMPLAAYHSPAPPWTGYFLYLLQSYPSGNSLFFFTVLEPISWNSYGPPWLTHSFQRRTSFLRKEMGNKIFWDVGVLNMTLFSFTLDSKNRYRILVLKIISL